MKHNFHMYIFQVTKYLELWAHKWRLLFFFSISILFTNLQLSKLGIEILDHLILIIKKWPSNACVGVKLTNTFDFLVFKECRLKNIKS
jgi:hypothetical protein